MTNQTYNPFVDTVNCVSLLTADPFFRVGDEADNFKAGIRLLEELALAGLNPVEDSQNAKNLYLLRCVNLELTRDQVERRLEGINEEVRDYVLNGFDFVRQRVPIHAHKLKDGGYCVGDNNYEINAVADFAVQFGLTRGLSREEMINIHWDPLLQLVTKRLLDEYFHGSKASLDGRHDQESR